MSPPEVCPDSWPDRRLLDLFGIEVPLLQAPMAGASSAELAIGVGNAGGLGALPCGMASPATIEENVALYRAGTKAPLNLNFFCHEIGPDDPKRDQAWLTRLSPYYDTFGAEPPGLPLGTGRPPFGAEDCALVETLKPEIVSFHFGLPEKRLLERVKAAGCKIICSATSLAEAEFLATRGVDAIIAQGAEAGGHHGMFLEAEASTLTGTLALTRAISAAMDVPVIAAGGIADGHAIAASLTLGASAVQIGTAFLLCPESLASEAHRAAISDPNRKTAITNVLSGRPARAVMNVIVAEQGPLNKAVPTFPRGSAALAPLRAKAEARGSSDFSPLWSGQAAHLPKPMQAGDLTAFLAKEALEALSGT